MIQQAAGAALACGTVIVPYVFTQAMEGLRSLNIEDRAENEAKGQPQPG